MYSIQKDFVLMVIWHFIHKRRWQKEENFLTWKLTLQHFSLIHYELKIWKNMAKKKLQKCLKSWEETELENLQWRKFTVLHVENGYLLDFSHFFCPLLYSGPRGRKSRVPPNVYLHFWRERKIFFEDFAVLFWSYIFSWNL